MTVQSTVPFRKDYDADGTTNIFAYPFQIFEAGDITVYLNGVVKTLNTDYTVSDVGNASGGNITFTMTDSNDDPVDIADGDKISFVMDMDLDRTTNYQPSGAFLAADVNDDFDRLWLATNQQAQEIDRSLRLKADDITTSNMEIPAKDDRKGKLLGFNATTGDPEVSDNNKDNWNAAYNDKINSASFSGSTLTLTQQDGGTVTASHTPYLPTAGGSVTGDIDFGSSKAIFGSNDDLQIYNFLGASIIKETGTGNLELRATDLILRDDSGGKYAQFTEDGDAKLFYDNSEKLATTSTGIDVTGTVAADGLTLVGTAYIQSTTQPQLQVAYNSGNITGFYRSGGDFQIKNDNGAGTPESSIKLDEDGAVTLYHDNSSKLATTATGADVTGTLTADGLTVEGNGSILELDNGSNPAQLSNTNGNVTLNFDTSNVGRNYIIQGNSANIFKASKGGNISFYEDTGTNAKFFWDASAERLGIGTTSPGSALTVKSSSFSQLRLEDDDDHLEIGYATETAYFKTGDNNTKIKFRKTNNTDVMTVDMGNERVGIGSNSPVSPLQVNGTIYAEGGTFDAPDDGQDPSGSDTPSNIAFVMPRDNKIAFWHDGYVRNLLHQDPQGVTQIGQLSTNYITGINLNCGTSGDVTIQNTNGNAGLTVEGALTSSGLDYPTSDGTNGQVIVTDGSGNLSFADQSGGGVSDIVDDTTPQLGGDLDLNSSDITGTGNIDITGTVTADDLSITSSNNVHTVLTSTTTGSSLQLKDATTSATFSGASVIGDTLGLYTNNNERIHMQSDGDVGIGTSSPDEKLEVNGNIKADNLYVGNGTHAAPSISFSGDTDTGISSSTANTLDFSVGGNDRMRLNSSGDLLINTTSDGSRGAKLRTQGLIESSTGFYASSNGSNFEQAGNYGGAGLSIDGYTTSTTATQKMIALRTSANVEKGNIQIKGNHVLFGCASGNYLLGGSTAHTPTAKVDIDGDTIRLRSDRTPASATASGNKGDICYDSDYMYVCVATNTWKRIALATW